jgi:hypothetical protein
MKWYEMQGAISIDLERGMIDPDLRLKEGPKELCGSLVEITSDGTVILVHPTARR